MKSLKKNVLQNFFSEKSLIEGWKGMNAPSNISLADKTNLSLRNCFELRITSNSI